MVSPVKKFLTIRFLQNAWQVCWDSAESSFSIHGHAELGGYYDDLRHSLSLTSPYLTRRFEFVQYLAEACNMLGSIS
jgi:hypothetical protein